MDSRSKVVDLEIEKCLEGAPTETSERRAERRGRYEVLAGMFLSTSRLPDAAQLAAYFRTTSSIPSAIYKSACDRALRESEKGFAPSIFSINKWGEKLEAAARKAARGANGPG